MSRAPLASRFRAATGLPAKESGRQGRVEGAKRLLRETDEPLEVLAERVGFADASHLSRVFRQLAGRRPGAPRQAAR